MIVGVDAGNYEVKTVFQKGHDRFLSDLGEYRERRLKQEFSKDDMVVEYKGRRYFAGTLAQYESEFNASLMGESKSHEDCKLRVLIALHRIGYDVYKIVVGQPIGTHTNEEKHQIKEMLIGEHLLAVNGTKRNFVISRVEVAAEGGSAFWGAPQGGIVRVIDVGSGTVNCATLHDRRYIDKDSFSIMIGINTTKTQDPQALARRISAQAGKKWGKYDLVKIVGGAAHILQPYVREYFPKAAVMQPLSNEGLLEPVYANAVGFYRIGVGIYGN